MGTASGGPAEKDAAPENVQQRAIAAERSSGYSGCVFESSGDHARAASSGAARNFARRFQIAHASQFPCEFRSQLLSIAAVASISTIPSAPATERFDASRGLFAGDWGFRRFTIREINPVSAA